MRRMIHRFVLRPVLRWLTGFEVRGAGRLPRRGPAIVVANHNSHIDTALLLAAFPSDVIDLVRPAAAADYWYRNRVAAWFSRRVVRAVPVDRSGAEGDPLAPAAAALAAGEIIVLFPEGTRGEPGHLGAFKTGVARLVRRHPESVVVPVRLDGCDVVLPRRARRPRRHRCVVRVGRPVSITGLEPRRAADTLRRLVAAA